MKTDFKRTIKISKYLYKVSKFDSTPVSIQSGITDFCFNKCHMCSHHRRKEKYVMDYKIWTDFLSEHPKIESVCYSGGDPLAHPQINEIMEYHINKKLPFGMITAGFAPKTVDSNLLKKARWIRVSLDTINPAIYQKARGGLDIYTVINSIENLVLNGVNIELTMTVSDLTLDYIDEVFNFAINHKINIDIHPVFGKKFNAVTDIKLQRQQEIFKAYGLNLAPHGFATYDFQKCYAPYYQIFIDSIGDIYPCCTSSGDTELNSFMNPLGNISNWQDFLIKRNNFVLNFSKKEICTGCIERFCSINNAVEIYNTILNKNFF